MNPTDCFLAHLKASVHLRREMAGNRTGEMPPVRFYGAEDLVLQHGQNFVPARRSPLVVEPRECFRRSYFAATRRGSRWIYTEGFGYRPNFGLAIHHAWLTRADTPGVAYDVAWEETGDVLYLGVPLRADYVRQVFESSGKQQFGVLMAHWLKYPLLTGKLDIESVIWQGGKSWLRQTTCGRSGFQRTSIVRPYRVDGRHACNSNSLRGVFEFVGRAVPRL
jgi:hypothetical protein